MLRDEVGRGVGWANGQLADFSQFLEGDYIWILDDDDLCIRPTLFKELNDIAEEHGPDVIMLKMDHGPRGILPDPATWGKRPAKARVGCSAFVVKKEIWQKHAEAWRTANYSSDFDFINSIFDEKGISVYWHDVVASRVQMIGLGQPQGLPLQEDRG